MKNSGRYNVKDLFIRFKTVILGSVVCFLPSLLGIYLWKELPETIPVHFNAQGTADGYAPKWIAVFMLPAFLAVLNAFVHFAMEADSKKKAHPKAMTTLINWIIPVISAVVNPICILKGMGKQIEIQIIISALLGILYIFIGNYLPKCRQNATMGIRLPWTLKDEDNWNKTHRFAGYLWIICGLLILVCSFLDKFLWLFIFVFISIIIPTVYSYKLSKKQS